MQASNPKRTPAKPRLPKLDARMISTEKIRPPKNPSRETMDEAKLQELIDSIALLGLIEPLVVEPEGELFYVLAGHRRFVACQALALPEIPCVVRKPSNIAGEAITAHENAFREDLNPGEEAKYFAGLLDTSCGGDTDVLAAKVGYSRQYVEGRLALIAGDSQVFDALLKGSIAIGVAVELNKVRDHGMKLVYLDSCLRGGASVTLVREWRIKANLLYGDNLPTPGDQPPAGVVTLPAPQLTMACFFCGSDQEVYAMELVYLHRFCKRAIDNVVERRAEDTKV